MYEKGEVVSVRAGKGRGGGNGSKAQSKNAYLDGSLEKLELGEVGDIETKDLFAVESCVCVDGFFIVETVVAMVRRSESMLLLLENIDGLRVRDTEDGAGQGHGGSCPSSTHGMCCLCLFVIACRCVRGN